MLKQIIVFIADLWKKQLLRSISMKVDLFTM